MLFVAKNLLQQKAKRAGNDLPNYRPWYDSCCKTAVRVCLKIFLMKRFVLVSVLALALVSCGNRNARKESKTKQGAATEQAVGIAEVPDTHNSRNSVDFAGTYRGVIPCADCSGIEVEITIDYDGSFTKRMTYLNGRKDNTVTTEGTYRWNDLGSKITLDGGAEPLTLLVGENRLFILDADGNRMTGSLADKYILERVREKD